MKVRQMTSPRSGNPVPNQFTIWHDGATYFQSYSTMICRIDGDKVTLDPHYNYSRTTTKYLSQFLGFGIAQIRTKIAEGEYEIEELN